MNERKKAEDLGEVRFFTGRPCRKGHVSERYTSSGQCVACLDERTQNRKESVKQARIAKNTALFEGLQPFPVFVRPSQKDDVSRFCDIMRYGSQGIIEQTNAFVALMRQQAIDTFGKD